MHDLSIFISWIRNEQLLLALSETDSRRELRGKAANKHS